MFSINDIIGNEPIKDHMIAAVEQNKVSHCYILNGEEGMGKNLVVKAFVRMLLCEGDRTPECRCRSCKQLASGNHPDVFYVQHEKPNTIGVDDIREGINNPIMIKPYQSEYKVYIVDEAEKMTVQAQNALLKTMEEPPKYAILFLLTTNANSFLPTILSRSILLNLRVLSDDQIREQLVAKDMEPERIDTIVKLARGNLGKALKFADSEDFSATTDKIMYLLKNIRNMTLLELLDTIQELKEDEFDTDECLDFIQMWFRDVLLFKVTSDINLIVFDDEYSAISDAASICTYAGIENIIKAVDVARRRLDSNVNYELAMELLLLTIQDNCK